MTNASPTLQIQVFQDGDQWCALAGPNLQDGTSGFSYSPSMALRELADALEVQDAEKEPPAQLCDDVLEAKLSEYLALREAVKQHEALKKLLKPIFEGQPHVLVGKYKITGSVVNRRAYTVGECSYWNWQIKAR